jgi:hypothetical protein
MGWFWKDKPPTNVIPFRKADRPEVLKRLRDNVYRQTNPVKVIPAKPASQSEFVPMAFECVDDVLRKVQADIRRGLIDPSEAMVFMYDKPRQRMVWYQFGFDSEDALAVVQEWYDELTK